MIIPAPNKSLWPMNQTIAQAQTSYQSASLWCFWMSLNLQSVSENLPEVPTAEPGAVSLPDVPTEEPGKITKFAMCNINISTIYCLFHF